MLHGLTILRLDADAIITRLIFIIFDESNPQPFHLGGIDLSTAPVVVADGFRVSSARLCLVESACGPRLPGDDRLEESANLDSTKARDTALWAASCYSGSVIANQPRSYNNRSHES